jgi:hypothetical protein
LKSKTTRIAIAVGVGIIALAIFFTYSADQAKNRGKAFGDNLQAIQDELKQVQTEFYSQKTMLEEGSITKEQFAEFGKTHLERMNQILAKYKTLSPPESFVKSVELFRTSTQLQIESDQYLIEWIATNDTSHKVRSDELLQESFENEMAALASFSKAKQNAG